MIKSGDKKYKIESDLLRRILDRLEQELPVRGMEFTDDERKYVNDLFLLTTKPVLYAANVSEADMGKDGEDIPLATRQSVVQTFRSYKFLNFGRRRNESLDDKRRHESAASRGQNSQRF